MPDRSHPSALLRVSSMLLVGLVLALAGWAMQQWHQQVPRH
jgi:hypothetical protein